VRTRGIGFAFADDGEATTLGAETLGQSTEAVLKRAGVSESAIAELRAAGVIRTATSAAQPATAL